MMDWLNKLKVASESDGVHLSEWDCAMLLVYIENLRKLAYLPRGAK